MHSRSRRRRLLPDSFERPRLASLAAAVADPATAPANAAGTIIIPPEFTPHQYALFLLHIAAEIEHVLMVQYLFAGFTLGGPQVPAAQHTLVARWREVVLGIAKEEMGHLMTVQNILRCLGGPLNFDREDYPWDSEFFPFPFSLEPLSRTSLAKYIFTEAPPLDIWDRSEPDAREIQAIARDNVHGVPLHQLNELYDLIKRVLEAPNLIPDSCFSSSTFPFQANWDEWGRGYRGGARGNTPASPHSSPPPPAGSPLAKLAFPGTPDLLLLPVVSRSSAVAAVIAISTQGEATAGATDGAASHFNRFLQIYRQFPKKGAWDPCRKVAANPIVSLTTRDLDPHSTDSSAPNTQIKNPQAAAWAHLFNVRYRLLLTNLQHTFFYPNNVVPEGQLTPRGLLLHAAFGEMYNLRALSQILMELPLAGDGDLLRAGPPFQMPFTLALPIDLADRWRQHRDLLLASTALAEQVRTQWPTVQSAYLVSLLEADRQQLAQVEALLAGAPIPPSLSNRYH